MSKPTLISKTKNFSGWWEVYSHPSESTKTEMKFSVFRPPQAEKRSVPVLYWLSGLTCTEENFMAKAGAGKYASDLGIMIVAPDTSPRGANLPNESQSWDLGLGAGFYVNATEAPWSKNYRMFDYVAKELPQLLKANFPVIADREGISGHSMGGHGAMVLALRQPGRYRSISAFSPIVAPTQCPWGEKAFTAYLGSDRSKWSEYDTHQLVQKATMKQEILVDQGTDDKFLKDQLKSELLQAACAKVGYPLTLRFQEGYDHSYYFISTFIESHLAFHARELNQF